MPRSIVGEGGGARQHRSKHHLITAPELSLVRGTTGSYSHPELETLFSEDGVGAEEPPGQRRGDGLRQEVEVSHKPTLALEEEWMQDVILPFSDQS